MRKNKLKSLTIFGTGIQKKDRHKSEVALAAVCCVQANGHHETRMRHLDCFASNVSKSF